MGVDRPFSNFEIGYRPALDGALGARWLKPLRSRAFHGSGYVFGGVTHLIMISISSVLVGNRRDIKEGGGRRRGNGGLVVSHVERGTAGVVGVQLRVLRGTGKTRAPGLFFPLVAPGESRKAAKSVDPPSGSRSPEGTSREIAAPAVVSHL